MPSARGSRSLKFPAALAALLLLNLLGSFRPAFARLRPPALVQSQSDSAKPPQTQPSNTSDTTSKPTPPAATNTANTPSSPPMKADLKKAKQANKQGLRAEEQGDWSAAYEAYSDAVNWAPNDSEYFTRREIAKSHVVQMKVDLAERHAISGEIPAALRSLREARELDPSNKVIRDRLTELAALDPSQAKQVLSGPEPPREVHLEHSPGKQDFKLRGDTQGAYEEVARRFGVDVAFDVDLRSRQIHLDANELDFPTVMRILGEESHTFWRPLTKHLFFVADDTTQKRKDYDVSIVRTILFSATQTPEQMTEISHLVRDITGITRIQLDTRSRTLTMRASPQAIAVASGVIDDLDQPTGELVLEIEILEMDRNYANQLGILPPQTATVLPIPSNAVTEAESGLTGLIAVLTQIFGSSSLGGLSPTQLAGLLGSGQVNVGSLIPPVIAFGGGASTFLATLPGATASFSEMLSLVRHGRRILLRAGDNRPATFFVGERFPVSLAQFSASLSSTGAGVSIPGVTGATLPVTTLDTGNAPDFVTTADLNADNFQDLIVSNFTDNTLSIFLGNGDGTFQNPITPPPATGVGPISIATGTFNSKNNTNVCLAVANQTANTLSILLGNGDGTFTAAPGSPIKTGNHPTSVVTATLSTEGQLDLIVANQQDNTVSIFMGNGDGTFAAPVNLATGNAPTGLVVADFNNDGKLDLAVTNQTDNSVSVYLGNGDGTFNKPISYPTGQAPVYVAAADFNGDNVLDLAVANNGAGTSTLSGDSVSILLGVGNGTFGATTNFPAGNGPTSIAIADFAVNGLQDLAVTAQTDNAVALLLGLGNGTFSPPIETPVGTNPISLVTAVFTDSGQPDLAVANNGSDTVSVILNSSQFSNANGTASTGTQFPNAEYIDVGVKVKATPRIHQNDEVTLQLEFSITSLTGTILNNIPVVSNEEIHQTVRLKTDQTAALAGFRSPQYMRGLNGTPGLGEVPDVGLLAASQDVQKQDTEVMILVTPRMVALAPRKDHLIYAGRGAPEGAGVQGPTHQERQERLERPTGAPSQAPPPAQPPPPAELDPGSQPQQQQPPQPQPAPPQQPEPQ